eukprot:scaffold3092_cov121-Isochrysis_galbana.AAC.10
MDRRRGGNVVALRTVQHASLHVWTHPSSSILLGGGDSADSGDDESCESDERPDFSGEGEDGHDDTGQHDARRDAAHRLGEGHAEQVGDDDPSPAAGAWRWDAHEEGERQPARLARGETRQLVLRAIEQRLQQFLTSTIGGREG